MQPGVAAFAPSNRVTDAPSPVSSMARPRVSVALCVYNGGKYLPMQLGSLLAQQGVDLEIVAVDDCSTDDSLDVLNAYARFDKRLRVHANADNLGHLRSFEKCMSLCTAPLIAPCDQDDVWDPHKLAKLADAIGDADMAYCDSAYIDGDGRPLGRNISCDLKHMHAGRDPLPYVFRNTVSGHALLVRRDVLDAALPFPAQLYHDWWLAIRAAAGNGVVYVDEPLVQFRRHVTAVSPLGKHKCATHKERKAERVQEEAEAAAHAEKQCRVYSDRKWLDERLYLLHALGNTEWPGSKEAREMEAALQAAVQGHYGLLWRAAWRNRASLPPHKGFAWWNALQFVKRTRRKLKRAPMQEPVAAAKLFRV